MRLFVFILSSFFLFVGCKDVKKEVTNLSTEKSKTIGAETGELLANPITYDVVVKNPDPDDTWAEERLEDLNLDKLIELIFGAIEDGQATAFNYHTGETMSMKDIKKLEKTEEFEKSKIAKVQFVEDWYFDAKSFTMQKKVKSIMLAYEVYDQFGKIRGYKAAFKIDLNE